jgi:hypothetical protein
LEEAIGGERVCCGNESKGNGAVVSVIEKVDCAEGREDEADEDEEGREG